jgi:hypothetical protein
MAEQPRAPAAPAAPAKIRIDGVDYTADQLSDNAKKLIATLRMADREVRRMEAQLTLYRISRQTIANSLKAELPGGAKSQPKPPSAADATQH